jgi:hypothetical protein
MASGAGRIAWIWRVLQEALLGYGEWCRMHCFVMASGEACMSVRFQNSHVLDSNMIAEGMQHLINVHMTDCARFWLFTAMLINVQLFLDFMPCRFVHDYNVPEDFVASICVNPVNGLCKVLG